MNRAQGYVIRPSARVATNGPALYDGPNGLERVIVTSDAVQSDDDGVIVRACSYLDRDGAEFDTPVDKLRPCNDRFEPDWPAELRAPDHRRVDSVEKDGGRVYLSEPYKGFRPALPQAQREAIEKFDHIERKVHERVVIRPHDLNQSQADRLKKAGLLMASDSRSDRIAGREIGEAVQSEILAKQTEEANSRARTEALDLAGRRPEDALVLTDGKLARAAGDGLVLLHDSGRLDDGQYRALIEYRRAYQLGGKELGSSLGSIGHIRGTGENDIAARRVDASKTVTGIEDAVAAAFGRSGRGRTVLRLVAGQGRTMNAISNPSSGADRALNTKALVRVADIAIEWLNAQSRRLK